jgi:hypothetical protein
MTQVSQLVNAVSRIETVTFTNAITSRTDDRRNRVLTNSEVETRAGDALVQEKTAPSIALPGDAVNGHDTTERRVGMLASRYENVMQRHIESSLENS